MLRKKKTSHSSNPPQEAHIGWVMDSREHRARSASIRCADSEGLWPFVTLWLWGRSSTGPSCKLAEGNTEPSLPLFSVAGSGRPLPTGHAWLLVDAPEPQFTSVFQLTDAAESLSSLKGIWMHHGPASRVVALSHVMLLECNVQLSHSHKNWLRCVSYSLLCQLFRLFGYYTVIMSVVHYVTSVNLYFLYTQIKTFSNMKNICNLLLACRNSLLVDSSRHK